MYIQQSYPIRMISKAKFAGFSEHVAVQFSANRVAHLTPDGGEEIISFDEFAQGLPVKEIRRASPHMYNQILKRVGESARNPGGYRLIDRNCEHYASWLFDGREESPQIKRLAFVGIIALLAVLNK